MYTILSIDACADYDGSWAWNQWYNVGKFPTELLDAGTRKILAWFRANGYLRHDSQGKVTIVDDQFNLVIENRKTCEPLYAIAYGEGM